MRTIVINAQDPNGYASGVGAAARALGQGALVVFPTETVYGVAANAAHPDALERLREAKGRASDTPFTVHVGRRAQARRYLTSPSPLVRRLARKAWPGPLTLVCEEPTPQETEIARSCSPAQLEAVYHNGTVGLRCPDHSAAARLLGDLDAPIVASSANRHGNPPPLDLAEALRDLDGMVDYAIDAGRTRYNAASTVVEVRGSSWRVLRPGAIEERALTRMARSSILFVCTGNSCRSPMAEYMFRTELARRLDIPIGELAEWGYEAMSAGTMSLDGESVSSGALEEMRARGIDISPHRTRQLTVELIHQAEKVYVMSPEHERAVLDLVPSASGRVELLDPENPVADPFGHTEAEYQRCAEHLQRAVSRRVEEFVDEDRNW